MNACRSEIEEKRKELDLLIHRCLHFDKMRPEIKNEVIRELNEENKDNEFYDDLIIEEVEEIS